MEGMRVGRFPWHPSPGFLLLAVTVLARCGEREGRPALRQSTGAPGEGAGLALPAPGCAGPPGCSFPLSKRQTKAKSAGSVNTGRLSPFTKPMWNLGPPLTSPVPGTRRAPLTGRGCCQDGGHPSKDAQVEHNTCSLGRGSGGARSGDTSRI